jgi:hypothetical protein
MPRAKGKANYKVDALILVVEELLPYKAGKRFQPTTSTVVES